MADGVQIIWTPWRHQGELLQNRAWIFPASADKDGTEGIDMRRKACDQISAWKLRGNLPHAVESTWLLTEAILADEIPADRIPLFAVKAAYVMAISRFVTGLLDSQQESKYKISMYTKAQQIGLPALFVDLRHESTHGDMPSLTNLRSAAHRALRWLWDDYWSKLGDVKSTRNHEGASGLEDKLFDSAIRKKLDLVEHEGMGISQSDESAASEPIVEIGGWNKWQGHWNARPIGTS